MFTIRNEVKEMLEEVKENRRWLHRYPELGLDTPHTRAFIVKCLKEYGFEVIDEGMALNGVVAKLEVDDAKKSIGFRSDMDALPTLEENKVDYKSTNEYSHACGHDAHMAMLLGFAHFMSKHKDKLTQSLVFVFQPGEEGPGGAELMVKEGLFERFPMEYMIGTHVMGDVDKGFVASKAGPLMARNGEVEVRIFGQSAHGAMPQKGNDAILAASYFMIQVQSILSRNTDPLQSGVLTFGTIQGGKARNVICEEVLLQGTLRCFDDPTYVLMKQRIEDIVQGIEVSFGVRIELDLDDYYQVVNNDAFLNDCLKEVCEDCYIEATPKMAAEDFSFFQKEVPGLFYYTGIRDEQHNKDIHNSCFDLEESSLLTSIETNIRLLAKLGVYRD